MPDMKRVRFFDYHPTLTELSISSGLLANRFPLHPLTHQPIKLPMLAYIKGRSPCCIKVLGRSILRRLDVGLPLNNASPMRPPEYLFQQ